jgi:hypothetical protein
MGLRKRARLFVTVLVVPCLWLAGFATRAGSGTAEFEILKTVRGTHPRRRQFEVTLACDRVTIVPHGQSQGGAEIRRPRLDPGPGCTSVRGRGHVQRHRDPNRRCRVGHVRMRHHRRQTGHTGLVHTEWGSGQFRHGDRQDSTLTVVGDGHELLRAACRCTCSRHRLTLFRV